MFRISHALHKLYLAMNWACHARWSINANMGSMRTFLIYYHALSDPQVLLGHDFGMVAAIDIVRI
jgi:hypothetical protein